MPFTLAHGAAALPFRRPLIFSALLIGTFAPDFEYFLRFSPDDRFGHTLLGTLVLTIPVALGVLWLFHGYVKHSATALLPTAIQQRILPLLGEFRFAGRRFAQILGSILVGIATHLTWDAFTHADTWIYQHWHFLQGQIHLPIIGALPCYKALQHGSTLFGMTVLFAWFFIWYRTIPPSPLTTQGTFPGSHKVAICFVLLSIAVAGGIFRSLADQGSLPLQFAGKRFLGEFLVTSIALIWWELVVIGLISARRNRFRVESKYRQSTDRRTVQA